MKFDFQLQHRAIRKEMESPFQAEKNIEIDSFSESVLLAREEKRREEVRSL